MNPRIIIFSQEVVPVVFCLFPTEQQFTLVPERAVNFLNDPLAAEWIKPHQQFDWAAGDGGAQCRLYECSAASRTKVLSHFPGAVWQAFRNAAQLLPNGTDKRFLQLAVQYISAGGVDQSVLAAELDESLKEEIKVKNLNSSDV